MRVTCGDCRFWTQEDVQDSGILLPDQSEPWLYKVGECSQGPIFGKVLPVPEGVLYNGAFTRPLLSGHLGLPERGDKSVPEWNGCWIGKRRQVVKS